MSDYDTKMLAAVGMATSVGMATARIVAPADMDTLMGMALVVGAMVVGKSAFGRAIELASARGERLWEDLAQTPAGQKLRGWTGFAIQVGVFAGAYVGIVKAYPTLSADFSSHSFLVAAATAGATAVALGVDAALTKIRIAGGNLPAEKNDDQAFDEPLSSRWVLVKTRNSRKSP